MWKFIVLLTGFVLLTSCNNLKTDTYRSKRKDSIATRENAENVTIEYTDSGLLRARIQSKLMVAVKHVREPYIEMPKGVEACFFDPDGTVASYLSAEYGISYQEKKMVLLRRNVQVMNVKGERLNTEELIWDQNSGRIRTDKFVRINTRDQIIMGEGMESNQSFTDWEILNVRGTINVNNHDSISRNGAALPGSCGRGRH
ncbi:MAG: LPS export ABC transporter periplasmic protein LptC [Bacteroidetes bacterium]|nr:LPS export ABC transporter periplasmic protein LptC [Bacteroidota bacterium]